MKPLNSLELTKQHIKTRNGFGWSINGIEKQNRRQKFKTYNISIV